MQRLSMVITGLLLAVAAGLAAFAGDTADAPPASAANAPAEAVAPAPDEAAADEAAVEFDGDDRDAAPQALDRAEAVISFTQGVVGGPHDFSERTGDPGSACSACHVPHVQRVRATTQPATEQGVVEPAVELYRIQGQRQVFVPGRYAPGPTSLICLGCHDGTVAKSTIGSAHAMLAGVREGFSVPDGFVWRDHPIGVPYPRGDREYRPVSFATANGVRLPEGRIECVSCHDPHNTSGADHMLVMSNRRSALCLSCHIK